MEAQIKKVSSEREFFWLPSVHKCSCSFSVIPVKPRASSKWGHRRIKRHACTPSLWRLVWMVSLVGCVTTNSWSDVKLSFEMTHSSCILHLAINFCWASSSFLIICRRKKKPRDLRRHLKKQKLLSHFIQNAFSTCSRHIQGLCSSPNKENRLRKSGPREERR